MVCRGHCTNYNKVTFRGSKQRRQWNADGCRVMFRALVWQDGWGTLCKDVEMGGVTKRSGWQFDLRSYNSYSFIKWITQSTSQFSFPLSGTFMLFLYFPFDHGHFLSFLSSLSLFSFYPSFLFKAFLFQSSLFLSPFSISHLSF